MAGPISLVCITIFFIAIGSSNEKPRIKDECLNMAIRVLSNNEEKLNAAWKISSKAKAYSQASIKYPIALDNVWIYGALESRCYNPISSKLDKMDKLAPSKLISVLQSEYNNINVKLDDIPLQYWGVEMPGMARVNIYGTSVSIALNSLAVALQIAMLPIILLWLSSLYNTRHREVLVLAHSAEPKYIFPHITNLFYMEIPKAIKKRNRLRPYRFIFFGVLYSITRVVMLAIFIAPPVGFYIASIYLTFFSSELILMISIIFVLGIFSLANILLELNILFLAKHFLIGADYTK